jgi:NADH-quinone oxidoreductase subunit L
MWGVGCEDDSERMNVIATNSVLQALSELAPTLQHGSSAPASGGMITLSTWYAAIPLLPLLGFVLAALTAAFRVKSKLPAWLSVACLALSFVFTVKMSMEVLGGEHARAAIVHVFDWIHFDLGRATEGGLSVSHTFIADFAFYIDPLTCLWMLFVTGLATLIALYASEYMAGDVGAGYSRFFAAFCLFVFSMACLVMADNYLLLYLGWEGVGLSSYLLIGYFYKKPSAVAAAKKAFIVNRIGDLFLALGIMLIFVHTRSLEYRTVFERMQPYIDLAREGRWSEIPLMVQAIPLLLMGGAFGKSAQLPLYVWLPDAMEGPTPVSALIHAATMVTAGVFLVARNYPVFQCSEYALPAVAWVGGLTALLAATIGMAQFDIKRIMAYSTVSQLGYMFAGLGVLTSIGGAFHVLTHAFFKALLFLCCGAVMHGFAGQLDLRKLSGVTWMKGWGVVGIGMLVGCLNLAGFPFSAGFFSKDMIIAQAFSNTSHAFPALGWLLLLTAGLTAYYTFRVYFRVFVGPQEFEPGDELHGHGDDHGHDDAHGHADAAHGSDDHGAAKATDKADAHAGHDHFHPHAPGWAINLVLGLLAIGSILAAILYFVGPAEGGWVGGLIEESSAKLKLEEHAEGTFFGMHPHQVMFYVSGLVGGVGILVAYILHKQGRTTAATAKADALLPKFQPLARWAQHKWYVDEFYNFLIVRPLWVISHIFYFFDQFVIDNLVDFFGWMPRKAGDVIRPSQSGELHGYAIGMAGGIAVLIIIILAVAS